ncbi:GTP cyclohydrolase IIa [Nonomuraea phyllanthi]|uniref:GTP cyclohydrolase IIa n=1 Tax=Nonomuraea phyllanthi TaxID=2219224 RepID=A0A5C4VVV4_9ACTN|nr:GTP cyclohydrolase IIa [Nonomuraea phyllanthi]KAB8190279.1 GTP cyclohydrolase IIa [Nonomuraea phyllanthi]QFY05521.1 GTP cyclohydrolase IIa [Nonomuraea phyllanthi]
MDRLRSESRPRVTIGVVGPHDLVEQIMMIGADLPTATDWRLVGAPHTEEQETYDKFSRIADSIDVVLFTGPLQHDLARQAGELPVPATFVPMSGASLYASLLRGVLTHGIDPARVSIDSLPAADVDEAYGEIGVSTAGVHLSEYDRPESARGFTAFHEQLHRQGETTAALTTIRSVANRLTAAGVPVLRLLPTSHTLRLALNTAALLGTGSRLEDAQIAIVVVELAASAKPSYSGPGNYWQQELKLSLHRSLLADARLMGATVVPRDENSYVVTATVGALGQATDGFRVAPFMDRVRTDAGVAVEVGIGLGSTARDADANALAAVEKARNAGAAAAYLVGGDGTVLSLPVRRRRRQESEPVVATKAAKLLERLVERLDDGGAMVVDAEIVADVLAVSPRSARRVLQSLAEEGLAWPMPPVKGTQAGRPRQPYRLVRT